jgi:hypothetical protein
MPADPATQRRLSTSLSRLLIGSRRSIANAFVTLKYASRSSTTAHHAAAINRLRAAPAPITGAKIPNRYAGPHQGG